MMTEFGGAVAVPRAVRSSDSTTTIRVNDVIMIRIDGAIDSTVKSAISWIARSVTPPLPWPKLMLMSCANAGSVSDPAAIRVARYKTLRGNAAGLTKGSLGGPTMTPSRLRDFQNRSFATAQSPAAPSTARCGVVRCGSAAPAPPAARPPPARTRRTRYQRLVARRDTRRHRFGTQFGAGLGAAAQWLRGKTRQRIATQGLAAPFRQPRHRAAHFVGKGGPHRARRRLRHLRLDLVEPAGS